MQKSRLLKSTTAIDNPVMRSSIAVPGHGDVDPEALHGQMQQQLLATATNLRTVMANTFGETLCTEDVSIIVMH
uniref:Uncharacterized protein n=1 Tax=Romanomermis culicivorax TaxID=13658 RepID=A0A915HSC0_ROMCU